MSLLGEIERADAFEQAADDGVLRFITAGSVDDGKSTLIGRLLHDSRAVLDDQLAAVERASRRRGAGAIDLSLLTDGLEAEREQGITIDVAYRYFSTPRRKFIIADTPGHEQYTRNMVTAASTADAAVILVDAGKGVLPQTKRHLTLASLLGVRHILVAVNKMDAVGWDRAVFERVCEAMRRFAAPLALAELRFFPVSALRGDYVVERGEHAPWYAGPPLLEALEGLSLKDGAGDDAAARPLRFPVQLVSRPGTAGARRYAGTLASGTLAPGTEVEVLPSGSRTVVREVSMFEGPRRLATAGDAVTVTLSDELDVSRGDMLVDTRRSPRASRSLRAEICWLAQSPLDPAGRYLLKHTTRTVRARVVTVNHRLDIHTLERAVPDTIGMNDIAGVSLSLAQPIFCDPYRENRATGSFILIDEITHQTVAAGLVE
ncbi:MAG TPA: GTP-binding protein [Burkholderiales bacterium]|nr:GTP-binding protein [Burkholderiales bacterium]